MADDHLDSRELPRPGVRAIRPLPRGRGAPCRAGRRRRRREPSSAARGSRAQGRGLRRSAARRRCGDSGRGASDSGHRGAVLRTELVRARDAISARGTRPPSWRRRACARPRSRSCSRRCRASSKRCATASAAARGATSGSVCRMHSWTRCPRSRRPCMRSATSSRVSARAPAPPTAGGARARWAGSSRSSRTPRRRSGIRWVDANAAGLTLQFTPFEIAERLRQFIEARPSAWVFTSATLAIGEDFGAFRRAHRIA